MKSTTIALLVCLTTIHSIHAFDIALCEQKKAAMTAICEMVPGDWNQMTCLKAVASRYDCTPPTEECTEEALSAFQAAYELCRRGWYESLRDETAFEECRTAARAAASGCEARFEEVEAEIDLILSKELICSARETWSYIYRYRRCLAKFKKTNSQEELTECEASARLRVYQCIDHFDSLEKLVERWQRKVVPDYRRDLKRFDFRKMSEAFFYQKLYYLTFWIARTRDRETSTKLCRFFWRFLFKYKIANLRTRRYLKPLRIPKFNDKGSRLRYRVYKPPYDSVFDAEAYNYSEFDREFFQSEADWILKLITLERCPEDYQKWVTTYSTFVAKYREIDPEATYEQPPEFIHGHKEEEEGANLPRRQGNYYVFDGQLHTVQSIPEPSVQAYCQKFVTAMEDAPDRPSYKALKHDYIQFRQDFKKKHNLQELDCPKAPRCA